MAAHTLTREMYRNKVAGGWLGRMIGATLGTPFDGSREMRSVSYYDPVPGQAAADDGMDMQLLWLHALRSQGIEITSDQLAVLLADRVSYPWDEYGCAALNVRRALRPPLTGWFDNWFRSGSRGWARTEVWALTCPGAPQAAAAAAYRDCTIDHAGEGIWAAMFWAAMESAAFFVDSIPELLEVGLAMVPADSRVAQAVRSARDAHNSGASLLAAWAQILTAVRHESYADAPQNVGFAALALLYGGGDFGATLCAAAGSGFHASQSAAAVGALLGVRLGKMALPARWTDPIGESVIQGWGISGVEFERTVPELVEHTVEVAERVIAARCPGVQLVDSLAEAAPVAGSPIGSPPATLAAPNARPEPAGAPPPAPTDSADVGPQGEATDVAPAHPEGAPPAETAAPAAESGPADASGDDAAVAATAQDQTVEDAEASASAPTPSAPPPPPTTSWAVNDEILPLLSESPTTAVYNADGFELTVDYGTAGPVILPGVARNFLVEIRSQREEDFVGLVSLGVPQGWQVAVPGAQGQRQMLARGRMARYGFVLKAPESAPLQAVNPIEVVLSPEKAPAIAAKLPLLGGACWWFVGPFRNLADEGFEHAYGPEDNQALDRDFLARDGGLVRWQKMAFGETVMDLTPILRGSPGVAYGQTTLHLPEPVAARIVAHTNDGVKVWLNGQQVIRRHSHEAFRPTVGYGPAQADVDLKAGTNTVLVKVVECGEPVKFAFSVADRKGIPLTDLGNSKW